MNAGSLLLNLWPHRAARWGLLAAISLCLTATAYPPSPYHLIFGVVRDEYGTPLNNTQVQILLVSSTGSVNRSLLQPGLAIDVNYQLPVPMDALLKPDLYRSNALALNSAFKMYVVIGNTTNTPIISTSSVTNFLGQPTKMTRIDLTLGTDSNGDGIPDEWELAYLAAIGSNLSLSDLNATLDVGNNGRTLMQDFQLGLGALDPGSTSFSVRMVDFNGGAPILEFPTSSGLAYSVLGSTNLQQWAVLPFRLTAEGSSGISRTNFAATTVQTLQVQVLQSGALPRAQFFRISVQ